MPWAKSCTREAVGVDAEARARGRGPPGAPGRCCARSTSTRCRRPGTSPITGCSFGHRSEPGKGASVTSTLRAAGLQQLADRGRLQHRIDREDDPGGLAAPDREVGLRQVRQHEGDDIVLADAQAVEEVGGRRDLGEQRRVVPGHRPVVVLRAQEERQRRRLRRAPPRPGRSSRRCWRAASGRCVRWPRRRTCRQFHSSASSSFGSGDEGQGSSTARPGLPAATWANAAVRLLEAGAQAHRQREADARARRRPVRRALPGRA